MVRESDSIDQALIRLVQGRPWRVAPDEEFKLVAALVQHRLAGLLAYGPGHDDEIGPTGVARVRRVAASMALRARQIDRATRTVATLLWDRCGVRPLVLKGPAVARFYEDPRQRPYTDVDLLVPAQGLVAARDVLVEVGFRQVKAHLRDMPFASHEVKLLGTVEGSPLLCELHWCLFVQRDARQIQYSVLAENAEFDPALGALLPAAAQQLLILSLHWAHHSPAERLLIQTMDFVRVATPPVVDAAHALARRYGVEWALEQALADVAEIAGERGRLPGSLTSPAGLARAVRRGGSPIRIILAQARELGLLDGTRFLVRAAGPRRFRSSDGTVDWKSYRRWMREKVTQKGST